MNMILNPRGQLDIVSRKNDKPGEKELQKQLRGISLPEAIIRQENRKMKTGPWDKGNKHYFKMK
jgi:hypothetical protein